MIEDVSPPCKSFSNKLFHSSIIVSTFPDLFEGGFHFPQFLKIIIKQWTLMVNFFLHPEQKMKELRDGSIELTIKAVHDMEIIPKVLSLGPEAEIVSPSSARKLMSDMIRKLAKKYA